ncbi:MAG: hypothetical protein LEGION0398_MBIBDBAK_01327 [Legionellaceae bacterium]
MLGGRKKRNLTPKEKEQLEREYALKANGKESEPIVLQKMDLSKKLKIGYYLPFG